MRQRQNAPVSSYKKSRSQDPFVLGNYEAEFHDSNPYITEKTLFALCFAVRVANALLVQTYFNPDEHWQALEVAHRIVFGYGHLTWEWKMGLRSYLHPLVFAGLYKVLALLGLDTPLLMMKAPRLLQSIFSAVGDLYLYKLSSALFGLSVARWAVSFGFFFSINIMRLCPFLFEFGRSESLGTIYTIHIMNLLLSMYLTLLQLFSELVNWFMFFCFTRTLSNSLETVLTLVGLYYWPCMRASSSEVPSGFRKWGLAIAALACAIRPTSAIIWVYVGLLELIVARDRLKFIFLEVIPIGVLVLGFVCSLDRLMYGSWVLVPLNFLKFNFLSSGGDYYGTHKWHWYFTQGFTVMLFSFIPFSIAGIIKSKRWKVSGLIAWVLGLYSLLGHKEFRFVLPVLPIALMFSGYSLASIRAGDSPYGIRKASSTKFPIKMVLAIMFLLITNIPMALYMSLVHQRGTEDVMYYLSEEAQKEKVESILFLMPCHATPYYSALHKNLTMRFLDCTPSEEKGVLDESDRFMTNPSAFAFELSKNWTSPSHIVLFESEERLMGDFLVSHSYREIKRFFHAHFKVDRDLQPSVAVYAYTRLFSKERDDTESKEEDEDVTLDEEFTADGETESPRVG